MYYFIPDGIGNTSVFFSNLILMTNSCNGLLVHTNIYIYITTRIYCTLSFSINYCYAHYLLNTNLSHISHNA